MPVAQFNCCSHLQGTTVKSTVARIRNPSAALLEAAPKRLEKEIDKARHARASELKFTLEDIHNLQSKELSCDKLEAYSKFVCSIAILTSGNVKEPFRHFERRLSLMKALMLSLSVPSRTSLSLSNFGME